MRWSVILLVLFVAVSGARAEEEGEEAAPVAQVEYVEVAPDLVTNYGSDGRLRFLRAKVTVRADSSGAAAAVRHHMPFVRDRLLMALASQDPDKIHSMEGKDSVRQKALVEINAFLEAEGEPTIVDLLFTEYLVQ